MQSFVFQWFTHLQIVNSYSPKTKWTLVNIYREEEPQNNGLWLHQCWGQKISTRDRRSVQETDWDQCKGQKISARDRRSVLGTKDQCLRQEIGAWDKRSVLGINAQHLGHFMGSYMNFWPPFCTPKLNADLYMSVDLPLDKKLWKIRTGSPGCWAVAGLGSLGLQAAGPLGHGGLRAAGPQACF